jgi:NTP pyrophosphatase (non-canonical NTP hydrolase)
VNPPDYVTALSNTYPDTKTDLYELNDQLRARTVRAIDLLCDEALRCQTEHGFSATPAEDIALMHSELSEALEDIRDGNWTMRYVLEGAKMHKPVGVPSELADILIRVVGFARKHNIDLADAVVRKMLYNETRPYKHGGKAL